MVLNNTFTGMNHHSDAFCRVIDFPKWVNIRQGRKRAKTSLLNNLKVALGTILRFGWASTSPITVSEINFIKGTTALSIVWVALLEFNPNNMAESNSDI